MITQWVVLTAFGHFTASFADEEHANLWVNRHGGQVVRLAGEYEVEE